MLFLQNDKNAPTTFLHSTDEVCLNTERPIDMKIHPMKKVEHNNYHVILVTECSGVQHPIICCLFRREYIRAVEVSPKCPISEAPRYFVFALFLETLAARKMLVLMLILNRNSVFEFK